MEQENRKVRFFNRLYDTLWELGKVSGCHQRSDRSLFCKGKQFPVCARCTGAFVGYFVGFLLFPIHKAPICLSLILCLVMFVDWFVQHKKWKESNNVRRLITGGLCGFGLMQIYLKILIFLVSLLL